MDGSAFNGLADAFAFMFLLCCIFVPLGMWKFVEILIWGFHHISITLT